MNRIDYEHGLVIGKFYPPHAGHEYLIRTAARHCATVTVGVLWANVESIPAERRVAWLKDMFSDAENVRIVAERDDVRIDYHDPAVWAAHVAVMREAVNRADREYGPAPVVDVVFSSENYGAELARHFSAAHVCLDQSRALYPVSGTGVRAHPDVFWDTIAPAVRAGLALRVVVVGAESTGTTTLARDLANALRKRGGVWTRTAWVAEYGREYSVNLLALARAAQPSAGVDDIAWHSDDFLNVAQVQCQNEESAARYGSPVLICDTDALATCIWHERYMGCPNPAVAEIAANMPARTFYLLTSHEGVPFEDDGLRDGEHLRSWMTDRFREVLTEQKVPWMEVRGLPPERCAAALHVIDQLMEKSWDFAPPLADNSSNGVDA